MQYLILWLLYFQQSADLTFHVDSVTYLLEMNQPEFREVVEFRVNSSAQGFVRIPYATQRLPGEAVFPLPALLDADGEQCFVVRGKEPTDIWFVAPALPSKGQSLYAKGLCAWCASNSPNPRNSFTGLSSKDRQAIAESLKKHVRLDAFVERFGPPTCGDLRPGDGIALTYFVADSCKMSLQDEMELTTFENVVVSVMDGSVVDVHDETDTIKSSYLSAEFRGKRDEPK